MNVMVTNTKNTIGVFVVNQFYPCKQFVFYKIILSKLFLICLSLFTKNDDGYFVACLNKV